MYFFFHQSYDNVSEKYKGNGNKAYVELFGPLVLRISWQCPVDVIQSIVMRQEKEGVERGRELKFYPKCSLSKR